MNRVIKFRAWDAKEKKMIHRMDGWSSGSDVLCEVWEAMNEYEMVVMQFTGLTDKNGKEIYEGDIIQYQNECADRTPVLVRTMTPKNLEYIIGIGDSEWEVKENQYSNIEVIGNIHENPELCPTTKNN